MTDRFIITQEHNQCPNKLYKFIGNIEYVFDAIENETIHFSLSDTFNDPFDCKVVNDGLILDEDYCGDKNVVISIINKILLACDKFFIPFFRNGKDYKEMESAFFQKIENMKIIKPSEYLQFVYDYSEYDGDFSDFYDCIKKSFIEKQPVISLSHRVTSFSETNSSIPMWAYYADNHNGVCLEYTPSLLKDTEVYNSIQKVNYTETQKNTPCNSKNSDDLNSMFFNKANCWEHEREWRIVLANNIEKLYFPCLTGIYLGTNFRNKHGDFEIFSRIISSIQGSETEINLFEAIPDNYQYKLNFHCIMPVKGG